MVFAVGETVGPYQITRYIGQGGMATIFKAHQLTLDRDVALKVMHPLLKEDQSFLMRLRREASIVAKLHHPNIVTIFDVGESDGLPYLVMRYIEGKTLKALMQEGLLPTERILAIAHAVGGALTYAHAHGVLHRDVKPSNILIDLEDNVFLTDFGLARLLHNSESTYSRDMLIGSPQYISPEQAMSEPVDERSDVYSLGIVLYEMFTGRVPFNGDTPYSTVMAQINESLPPPRSINPAIPLAVEKVLTKALAKDPTQRYGSVAEMVTALENAVRGPQGKYDPETVPVIPHAFLPILPVPFESPEPPPPFWHVFPDILPDRSWLVILGGILAVCLLAPVAMFLFSLRQPVVPVLVTAPTPTRTATRALAVISATPAAIAPTVPLALTPLVVPAGTTVRPAATLLQPTAAVPAAESPRGRIAFTVALSELVEQHSIWTANANGTDARAIVSVALWGALSPDGKFIAYVRPKSPDGIYVANVDGSSPRLVVGSADTCCVQWSPDSKRLIYFRGNLKSRGSIYTINLDGTGVTEITFGFNPAFSPDGNRITYANCQANSSTCGVYVMDLKSKTATIITRDNGANPQWSPRGDKIVYQADDGKGHINLFVVNPDGTGVKQLTAGKGNDGQPTWSRDGNFIFWRSDQNGAGWAIFSMRADGTNARLVVNGVPASSTFWGRESLTTGP